MNHNDHKNGEGTCSSGYYHDVHGLLQGKPPSYLGKMKAGVYSLTGRIRTFTIAVDWSEPSLTSAATSWKPNISRCS